MRYRYLVCDVFTTTRFGGNPLAILPEAGGLDTAEMQQIAREFNFSESTFVFPGEDQFDRQVRIFTPSIEVPFAGHPNVGTAFALARDGAFGSIHAEKTVLFDEKAGAVPVRIRRDGDEKIWCELEAPQELSLGEAIEPSRIAEILSIRKEDIGTATHPPQVASVGLPFLVVELSSMDALRRARINMPALEKLRDDGVTPDIHLYVRGGGDDINARMFAPLDGVPEDPATGSANCALAALLTDAGGSGGAWRITQGVEMGRPSLLEARTRREKGSIRTWIGGYSVHVADGFIEVD